MAKSKYTKDRLRKIENALVRTGSDKVAMAEAGISKTTYFAWIQDKSDFSDLRTRARERHIELQVRTHPELEQKAVETLEKFLSPRQVTRNKEESKVIVDRETGEPIRVLEVKRTKMTEEREPDLNAVMKVLGPGPLETVLYRIALRKALEDPEGDLYERLFGKGGTLRPDKEWGDNVVADSVDLAKLAELRKRTEERYASGTMSFEEYHKAILDQAKISSMIQTQIETRAQRSIGELSYHEVIGQVRKFIELVMRVVDEVVNDVSVKKEDIRYEITRRVRERSGTELPLAGNASGQGR